jgi:hypothetical protein
VKAFCPPIAADLSREKLLPGLLRGTFEHQMFEEVRKAGFPRGLIRGANLVPDHVGDDGVRDDPA